MKLPILNIKGKETGKSADLSDDVFKTELNEHLLYLSVKQFLATKRQGTSKSKERAEIVGSTRKIKKQKGTGTARAGSVKSPIMRGGGRAFGPKPRDYWFKLNKKEKEAARKSALSLRAKEKQVKILEDFSFEEPKTKKMIEIFNNLELKGKKVLLLTGEVEPAVYKSARNLSKSRVLPASQASTYDVLNSNALVLTESGLKQLEQTFN
jgi:large subunit ribosomal protein L4